MFMINRDNTSSITPASTAMGILMDSELLLLEAVQGKRVLRSLQLPADVSEPGGLLEYLWDAGLHSAWVMPATTRSRTATCSWLEQASNRWVVSVHPDPQEPTRPISALLWPRERNQGEARRLALAFPEYAGWGWELTDARSLLATVSYLDQVLTRSVNDSPDLLAHALLPDLTRDAAISPLDSSPVDLYAFSCSGATPVPLRECARDVVWMRPLSVMEQRQRYVHKYVHLSRHLQAASRLHIHTQSYRHALGRANALHTITLLAELGISLLAQEQTLGGWSRPDWWIQVVGLGRALLFAQLGSMVKKGIMPVLVERDAFWVISDEAHPPSAVPGLVTAQRWRGYTAGYEAPLLLTSEVRNAWKCAQHAGELALALDTLAGEALPEKLYPSSKHPGTLDPIQLASLPSRD